MTTRRAELLVIAKAKDEASRDLKRIQDTFKGFKKAATFVSGAALALGGLGVMAVKQAAEVETLRKTFDALSLSIGESSDAMLADLRRVTRGLMTDANLIAGANRLMSMGLANTREEASKLTRMAVRLGKAMGKDAKGAFEEFTLLLANQSLPRLDTFGISAGKVRSRIAELQKQTKGLSREQAFLTVVMEQGEYSMERLGEETDTVADEFNRALVDIKNARVEIGQALMPVAKDMVELFRDEAVPVIKDLAQAFKDADPEQIRQLALAIGGLIALRPVIGVVEGIAKSLGVLRAGIIALGAPGVLAALGGVSAGLTAIAAGAYAAYVSPALDPETMGLMDIQDQIEANDWAMRMFAKRFGWGAEGIQSDAERAADSIKGMWPGTEIQQLEQDVKAVNEALGRTPRARIPNPYVDVESGAKKAVDAQKELRDAMRAISDIRFIGETAVGDELFRMSIEAKKLEKRMLEMGGRGAEGAEELEKGLDDLRRQMDIVRLGAEITFEPQQRMIERLVKPIQELAMQEKLNMLIALEPNVVKDIEAAATAMGLQKDYLINISGHKPLTMTAWREDWLTLTGYTDDVLANIRLIAKEVALLPVSDVDLGPGETYAGPGTPVGRQRGGPAFIGQDYLVGERGPEVLRMGAAGTIAPINAGPDNRQLVVNNYGVASAADIQDRFRAHPKTREFYRERARF